MIVAALLLSSFSLDEKTLDRTIDPCDDFYQFACGGWLKSTEIPPDRSRWERGFVEVSHRNQLALKDILETASQPKLKSFYAACMAEMDEQPTLQAELARIDAISDHASFAKAVAELHRAQIPALFLFGATPDAKDPSQVIGHAQQAGLGLPERDYYFSQDPKKLQARTLYRTYLVTLFKLLGDTRPQTSASAVLGIETRLAKGHLGVVELRDPYKIYHRLERAGLEKATPTFDWASYFGAFTGTQINVAQPEFFAAVERVLATSKLEDLKTYLRAQLLVHTAYHVGRQWQAEAFAFRSKALTGEKALPPRWRQCVSAADTAMGELVAQPFIAKHFGAQGKQEALAAIVAIEKAMGENIDALSWMDAATKSAAHTKLKTLVNKVGFPDRWKSYEALAITQDSHLANVLAARRFEHANELEKIGKPLDRGEWQMSPPTVNAYYEPLLNEIVFPAGIMQPPYFQAGAPAAFNFGALGMVMGHEITHGFDDEGRQFDAQGRLRDWWSPAVGKQFEQRAQCLVKQYDQYTVAGDTKINGQLTLGENIADLGGMKIAYAAFKAQKVTETKVLGFTPEQQFFVAAAQSWCGKRRDETARLFAATDPHSPPEFRVNGVIVNTPEFAQAFQCKSGSRMAPVQRCTVW